VIALAIALSFLLVDDLMVNEAGGRAAVTRYGPGYWVWMSSMARPEPRGSPQTAMGAGALPVEPIPTSGSEG
jgi:hypothetical protein